MAKQLLLVMRLSDKASLEVVYNSLVNTHTVFKRQHHSDLERLEHIMRNMALAYYDENDVIAEQIDFSDVLGDD